MKRESPPPPECSLSPQKKSPVGTSGSSWAHSQPSLAPRPVAATPLLATLHIPHYRIRGFCLGGRPALFPKLYGSAPPHPNSMDVSRSFFFLKYTYPPLHLMKGGSDNRDLVEPCLNPTKTRLSLVDPT